jgi:hypothetical protein
VYALLPMADQSADPTSSDEPVIPANAVEVTEQRDIGNPLYSRYRCEVAGEVVGYREYDETGRVALEYAVRMVGER